jgi:hypothetical protein
VVEGHALLQFFQLLRALQCCAPLPQQHDIRLNGLLPVLDDVVRPIDCRRVGDPLLDVSRHAAAVLKHVRVKPTAPRQRREGRRSLARRRLDGLRDDVVRQLRKGKRVELRQLADGLEVRFSFVVKDSDFRVFSVHLKDAVLGEPKVALPLHQLGPIVQHLRALSHVNYFCKISKLILWDHIVIFSSNMNLSAI